MKVLHVIPAVADVYGGPSAAIRALTSAQIEANGLEIAVATTDAAGANDRFRPQPGQFACPLHLFPCTFSERWKYSRELGKWLGANVSRFDIVHIHALWSYSSCAASRAAIRADVPYIIRPAGMLSEYSFSHRGLYKRFYRWLLEEKTIHNAAGFHATTEGEATDIRRVLPSANVAVISNGVDDQAWQLKRDRSWLRNTLKIDESTPVILFLSRLHPKKGIVDFLLPAFEQIKVPAVLVIVGGGDGHSPAFANQVAQRVNSSPKCNSIRLVGGIAASERWRYFDGADLFVLPSHSENFGIVVAESMARLCPVLISEGVQIRDHVRHAEAGEVVPLSIAQIADAIDRMLSDPTQLARYGRSGQEYSKTHFSWEGISLQVLDFYSQVVAGRKKNSQADADRASLN
jgi:glycosyltransferase involved in cell wall biosynthesis